MRPDLQVTGKDHGARLAEQLLRIANSDCDVQLLARRDWASITFSGRRYRFSIESPHPWQSTGIAGLQARLDDHEFDLGGDFVADILLTAPDPEKSRRLIAELLVITDPLT